MMPSDIRNSENEPTGVPATDGATDPDPAKVQASQRADAEVSGTRLATRTVLGLLLLFLAVAVGAYFLKDSLTGAGEWFFELYGLFGLFLGTIATDALGVPIPVDVYLAASVTADEPTLPTLLVACCASLLGGVLAYGIGKNLDRLPLLGRLVRRHRPRGEALFRRWGVAAVAVAAWTPVPFSIVCWFAGAFDMPMRPFLLSTLHRIPRIIVYYFVIALGWIAGGA